MKSEPITRVCLLTAVFFCTSSVSFSNPRALRPDTELFVDDIRIAKKAKVSRTIHPAKKLPRPVLVGENGSPVRIYGTVLRDEASGKFRMWYGRRYATSENGLDWEKPVFDFFPLRDQPSNIVLPKGGGGVLFDPADPDPKKRYKALLAEPIKDGGLSCYYSADGLRWQRYRNDRLVTVGSEVAMVARDPKTRQYFGFIRPYAPKHFPKSRKQKRLGAVICSDDFVQWSNPKIVLEPDAVDDAWVSAPHQRTEFYSMKGFAYGGSWLGIVPVFRIERILEENEPGQSRYDGPMFGQLITSRNGIHWSRMKDRSPVIPGGNETGTGFDISVMDVASAPLLVDDELWLYYTGISGTHGAPMSEKRITIGLARWRLDGFVSLDAGREEGFVETVDQSVLRHPARLQIDACIREGHEGFVVVEVLDQDGHVIPGYSRDECLSLDGDELRHPVRWKNHVALPAGKLYRLRFVFRNASLYSFKKV